MQLSSACSYHIPGSMPLLHGIAIRHNKERGYHVVATEDLPAGTCILQETPAAFGCTPQPAGPAYCHACLWSLTQSKDSPAISCQRCHSSHWCGLACQQQDAAMHIGSGECMLYQLSDVCAALGSWCREVCLVLRLCHLNRNLGADTWATHVCAQKVQQAQSPPGLLLPLRKQQWDDHDSRLYSSGQHCNPDADDSWLHAPLDSHVEQMTAHLQMSQGPHWLDKVLHLLSVLHGHAASNSNLQQQPCALLDEAAQRQQRLEMFCAVLVNAVEVQHLDGVHVQQLCSKPPTAGQLEASKIKDTVANDVSNTQDDDGRTAPPDQVTSRSLPPIALYRCFSRLNHACCPNAHYDVVRPAGEVRVMLRQPMHAGQEVTITYVDPRAPAVERRAELHNKYCFWCTCDNSAVQLHHLTCCTNCMPCYSHDVTGKQPFVVWLLLALTKEYIHTSLLWHTCSGMSYQMDFEDRSKVSSDDMVVPYDNGNFELVINPKSLLYLFGMQLDYSDALIGGGMLWMWQVFWYMFTFTIGMAPLSVD